MIASCLGSRKQSYVEQEVSTIATVSLETLIEKLSLDKSFRVKYCQNPDRTLENFLSPEEIRAIKTGDGHAFDQMGQGDAFSRLTQVLCGPNPSD